MMDTHLSKPLIRILHLEDSLLDHELVAITLNKAGLCFHLTRVENRSDFFAKLAASEFEVILADYRLPGFTALDVWQDMPADYRKIPFILLSGAIGESAAVEAIQLGMSDYLLKDDIGRLDRVIQRSLEVAAVRLAKAQADEELAESEKRLADFALHLQDTIEQERASIAREIHDDIGGSLAAIKFDLSWLKRHAKDPAAIPHIAMAEEMLQHALGASQRIMMSLRPAILDQGLEAALDWLARSFETRTTIKTSFHGSAIDHSLSKAIELTAYRTAQEALTNIHKYANCSLVRIELSGERQVLTLEIADNGIGISSPDLDKSKSFGIRGLRERARTVGGWLDVSTRLGSGTAIILSIPLTQPDFEPANESRP
jgi:signal transduction histidine kinase